eukprot:3408683-Amphidinium_carterae.1
MELSISTDIRKMIATDYRRASPRHPESTADPHAHLLSLTVKALSCVKGVVLMSGPRARPCARGGPRQRRKYCVPIPFQTQKSFGQDRRKNHW